MKPQCALLVLALAAATTVSAAADLPADVAPLRVRRIGGLAVVRGAIQTANGPVAAHFILDFGSPTGLIFPPDTAAGLGLRAGGSCAVRVDSLPLPNVVVSEDARAEVARAMNADHAAELEQIPVAGVLGLGAFAGHSVTLDLDAGTLQVDAPDSGPAAGATAAVDPADATFSRPPDGAVRFTVGPLTAGLDMLHVESQLVSAAVDRLKLGTPDAAKIKLGNADLLTSDAFRPIAPAAAPADVMLGVRWLGRVRVTVRPDRVTFRRTRPPEPAPAEQALLLAQWRGDADTIAAFLKSEPDGPLANDAALSLLNLRLNDASVTPTDTRTAVDAVAASFPLPRRARRLIALADQLLARPTTRTAGVVLQMLDAAAVVAKDDLEGRAIHEIHARQGKIALSAGDVSKARRLLIAAAYGLPGDPGVNADLGDLYAHSGQTVRAFSRYLDAALVKDPPATALRGLDRLWNDPAARAALPIADVQTLLEGRTPAAPPATQPTATLVELFTDDANPGDLGPALAFDGLRAAGGATVALAFHFGPAGNTALARARAAFYKLPSVPAVLGDGHVIDSAAADPAEAPALVARYLRKLATARPATRPTIELTADARWQGDTMTARVAVGPHTTAGEGDLRLFAFVCEPAVFAIGGNGLAVHHAVARAVLGDPDGHPIGNGASTLTLHLAAAVLDRAVADSDAARLLRPPPTPSMQTTRPALHDCVIAVVLQDPQTRQVIAARLVPATDRKARP